MHHFRVPKPSMIDAMLNARNRTHGVYYAQAALAESIVQAMQGGRNWRAMTPDQRHALVMIATKASRVLMGDANHSDSWADIAGYAQLVAERLQGRVR
jgi:hypothetical protein